MRPALLLLGLLLAGCGAPAAGATTAPGGPAEPAPWVTAEAACEGGDVYACYDAAGWYSGEPSQYPNPEAEGPEADLARMVQILELACERGDRDACEWMLIVVLVDAELAAAAELPTRLGAACERGDALSCVVLGVLRESDAPADALEAYRAGCDGGEPEGCYRAAMLRLEPAPEEARALLARACSQERQWGCMEYGRVLSEGVGGEVDRHQAAIVVGWVCALESGKAGARGESETPESCAVLASLTRP